MKLLRGAKAAFVFVPRFFLRFLVCLLPLSPELSAHDAVISNLTCLGIIEDEVQMIMALLGTEDPEELSEDEIEYYSAYLRRPFEINYATAGKLSSCGFFTQYETASLLDYRSRNGDILSLAELSLVDGFNEKRAAALAPFIAFGSNVSAGRNSLKGTKIYNDILLRTAWRTSEGGYDYNYGLKYRMQAGESFRFAFAADRQYDIGRVLPGRGSFHFACFGRKVLGKLLIGDYSLKYGQGLMLWNAFRMNTLSSPESFYLKANGISPYCSFSDESGERGVAADFNLGAFKLSASLGLDGLRTLMQGKKNVPLYLSPALNFAWHGRNATLSVGGMLRSAELKDRALRGAEPRGAESRSKIGANVISAKVAADFRTNIKGNDLFGEAMYDVVDKEVAALCGALLRIGDAMSLASRITYYKEEQSLALAFRLPYGERVTLAGKSGFGASVMRHESSFGTELIRYSLPKYGAESGSLQWKLLLSHKWQLNPFVCLDFRISERLRADGNRLDLRCDVSYDNTPWFFESRFNILHFRDWSVLGYLEGAWRPAKFAVYLRVGIFRIDNWDDRIYVYERDAPGCFNVPAFYGRGCWSAFNFSWKPLRVCSLHLRLSTVQYPWTLPSARLRPSRTEAKLQLMFQIG